MTNQARILDYRDVRTSRKASARFGHSQYAAQAQDGGRGRASSRGSSRSARSARSSRASRSAVGRRSGFAATISNLQQALQASRKRRASKQFDRSGYGRAQSSASGTRAAVHTGSMGSRQRRASRTYAQGSPYASAAKGAIGSFFGGIVNAIASFFARGHSLAFYVLGGFALCVVLAGAFLYPSVQNYYVAVRDNAQSQAEYEALQDYYNKLQTDVASLQTDEGVETRAHDKYGWVSPGENSVMVQGVQGSNSIDGTDIGIVPAGSVKAPETWYSGLLDPFFGYDK